MTVHVEACHKKKPKTEVSSGHRLSSARLASRVFDSPSFHSRLGEDSGLKALGMFRRGIIWNNDVERWAIQRKIFHKGTSSSGRCQFKNASEIFLTVSNAFVFAKAASF